MSKCKNCESIATVGILCTSCVNGLLENYADNEVEMLAKIEKLEKQLKEALKYGNDAFRDGLVK